MSDTYVGFSVSVPIKSFVDMNWWRRELVDFDPEEEFSTEDAESDDEVAKIEELKKAWMTRFGLDEEPGGWPPCEVEMDVSPNMEYVNLSCEGHCDVELVVRIIGLFLKERNRDDSISMEVGCWGSGPDAFGGVAVFITKDSSDSMSTAVWLMRKKAEHLRKKHPVDLSNFEFEFGNEDRAALDWAYVASSMIGEKTLKSFVDGLNTISKVAGKNGVIRIVGQKTTAQVPEEKYGTPFAASFLWKAYRPRSAPSGLEPFYEGALVFHDPHDRGGSGRPVNPAPESFPHWNVHS